ncbi:hypothetical protein [Saccharopolyspora antimicrobica]|nr:hypothetical protein [Saccharopolyspora antimicrobica]
MSVDFARDRAPLGVACGGDQRGVEGPVGFVHARFAELDRRSGDAVSAP